MIVGDDESLERFASILDQLQRQVGPARELRLIELRFSTPQRVIAFLEDLRDSSRTFVSGGGAEPVFEAIEETGSVLVAAQPDQLPLIEQLVRTLDSEQASETPPLRIMRLRTTDASNLAQVLQSTYARRPADERSKKPVDVRADAATNTLIVSAHPDVLPEIEAIARQLNETQSLDDDDRQIRIFPLRVARAEDLARTIDAMFPEPPMPIDPRTRRPRPDLRQPREVVVRADRATNSLIVDAPAKRLAGFERIVESLDQEALAGEVELRTYNVDRVDLDAATRTLRELASSDALGAASRAPVSVSAEPRSRTLVVSGPPEIFERVESVLAELQSPPDRPSSGLKMFPLAHTRAERLQPLLERLLVARLRDSEAGAGRLEQELRSLLDVAAEPATNTLIVSAPEDALVIASELIEALDTPSAASGRDVVRVAPLTFAPAPETAETVRAAAERMALPSGGSVSVTAAPGSNAIVLSGSPKDLDALSEIIESLDQQPSDAEAMAVETLALEHADARELAQRVERLLVEQRDTDPRILSLRLRYNRNALERPPPIRVEADERTNALIVSGPAATVALARTIVERLDRPQTGERPRVLTYTPSRARAEAIVASVRPILAASQPSGRERVTISADATTGAVIVMGSEAAAAEAVRLVMDFDDRTPAAPAFETASISLESADANAIGRVVREQLNDRTRWPESLRAAERAGVPVASPSVQPDTTGRRLIVTAPGALVDTARAVVEALDTARPSSSVRVFRLERGDAEGVARAVESALAASLAPGAPEPSVIAEPASNSVLVTGNAAQLTEAGALIASMDASTSPDALGVRTVVLEHARAEAVAPVLERVLTRESAVDQLPVWARGSFIARYGEDSEPTVRVSADRRLNAVVVSGPPSLLDLAETLARELDLDADGDPDDQRRLVRVIPMTHGDAAAVASSLTSAFAEDEGERLPPSIGVDAGANALIVRADADQLELVETLTAQLDRASLAASREVRTIPLDRSRVEAGVMAATLQRLLERRGGVRVQVISADELLRQELEQGPARGLDETINGAPSRPSGALPVYEAPAWPVLPVHRVGHAAASAAFGTVASAVRFGTQASAPIAGDELPDSPEVTIAVDPTTNSMVVIGSPRLTDRIARLAAELEAQMPAEPVGVRVIDLPTGVDARAVASLVGRTVQQVGRVSAQNPGGFTGRVAAVADPAGDAVVVWANDTDFASLRGLIAATARDRDEAPLVVRVYPLNSVSGAAAARAVRDLIAQNPRGRQAQRVRRLELGPEEGGERSTIDPSQIRVSTDPGGASLIVVAPREAFGLIDRFVGLIDQSPVRDRLAIRRYELANASAAQLSGTLQRLFDAQRQGPGARDLPRARFVADGRTNAMLVTASGEQHDDVERLILAADTELQNADLPLEIIELAQARPSAVRRVVEEVVIGRDPAKRDRVRIAADDQSNLFMVRAPEDDLAEIRRIVAEVDAADTSGLPIRVITLERADPEQVATALRAFLDERARSSGDGRRARAPVAITAHRGSQTLVVAAAEEPFADIQRLIEAMDAEEPRADFVVRIVPIEHAEFNSIRETVQSLAFSIQTGFSANWWNSGRETARNERIEVYGNESSRSLVLIGAAGPVGQLESLIDELDQPLPEGTRLTARAVRVAEGDLSAIAQAIRSVTATPDWRWWQGPDPNAVQVSVDARRRTLVLIGREESIVRAEAMISDLAASEDGAPRVVETIALEHARADRAARSLQRFFDQRAVGEGQPTGAVSIIGSTDGNVLIVAADEATLPMVRSLAADLDRPELGDDRSIEVYALRNASPNELAPTIRQMFPERRADERVIVTPQQASSSLIVSAPRERIDSVTALVERLDAPPTADDSRLVTVPLVSARASEVAQALTRSLPASVRIRITPIARSNSVLLAGSPEAIELVRAQIEQIDTEPTRSLSVVRRFPLEHAVAEDAWYTLTQLLRGRPVAPGEPQPSVDWLLTENSLVVSAAPGDMDEIATMVAEIDRPDERDRRTEFVRLEFAEAEAAADALGVFFGAFAREARTPAEHEVTIVPDPASNSLVISAGEDVWPQIQALITKLDTADYDTSRQLAVIALTHANAENVARALNEGFRPTIEDRARVARQRGNDARREGDRRGDDSELPTVLVAEEGAPVVSAEPETNALIVFAGRRDLDRVRQIVEQLDVPEFARTAPPRIIPVSAGRASEIAATLSSVFERGSGEGRRTIAIQGSDPAAALIVRAPDDVYAEIVELASSLVEASGRSAPAPRVIRLASTPAVRMRSIVLAATRPMAERRDEPLVVEADRAANALVVTASGAVLSEVERLVRELDGDGAPGEPVGIDEAPAEAVAEAMDLPAGQSLRIVDLEHHAPESMRQLVEQLGVTRAPGADESGLVVEPVRVVALTTRRAVSLMGATDDVAVTARLIGVLDREPVASGQAVRVVALRFASANAVATTLRRMLDPGEQSSRTGPAEALAEQVRRLNMLSNDVDQRGLAVDLSRPIRLIPDEQTNNLLIASTPGNVEALREVAAMLDTLPLGDAVVVRIFPLEHAAATRIQGIVQRLFQQGEALRRLPGTQRRGLPPTATGQALAGEVALSVDDRTNALIVAGREEAVALVEVLIGDLDSDRVARWIEPALMSLEFADADEMATMLRRVLVESAPSTPEAEALRRQVGRLRMAIEGDSIEPGEMSSSDVFMPLTSLVIAPEPAANALLVIGSPANLALVRELVSMLDVEAAAAGNQVRVYPLEHAAAERVAGLATQIFEQREAAGALRRQDRLTVAPDARTNALIVSTSPRGFGIFETLIRTLDAPDTNFSVGLHVLPVVGADAGELAPRLQRLMDERLEASRRAGSVELPTDAFRIEADRANNLLIVAASDENLGVIESLLTSMSGDAAAIAEADRTELITVRNGRAEEVAETIRELYADRENDRRGERSVGIVANDRLNAIIVSGTDEDIEAVQRLVDELESTRITAVQDVRRIELKAANALEVVNLIQTVLSGRTIDGRRGASEGQATRLRFFRRQVESEIGAGDSLSEAGLDAAIRSQVRLTPDLRTNSVVVTAPPEVLALVEAMIEDLDSTTAGSRKIEIFELANADARAMAVVLRDLFNLEQQGDRFVLIPTQTTIEEDSEGFRLGQSTLTPVPDERQELSITIDARTNTILVSGTAEYLQLVAEVVDRLDEIEANERESLVYHLQNAQAAEAEQTLQSYFETEAQRIRDLLGPDQAGSALRQLEQEVTVVGDVASNKLVVSASPRYVDTVTRIIDEIDAAPPQVMIQVLLAEVTLDEEDTWGADFEIGPLGGQAYQVATSAASGGVATAIGTPNLSVATADFSLLVRALEVQGKLEVLSRPQVTVNNNEPAFIQVGEDVAIVTGVERLDSGNTRSDVERRDVGIILNVTPSISNDGFVRMDIAPEISSVTARTTQVSEDFEAPIISQRRIETTVTVQDGETVVIGGLIQSTEQDRVSKVPLLGDIPVIGLPFRATERSRVKTELLVILTPTVIPGDSPEGLRQFRLRTQRAIDEMSQPGRIREAVRGTPSPELGRPKGPGPPPEGMRESAWEDDDSLFPRGRDGVGGSP
ncbi:MAG: secretin N-terminal domain-containing protein [Planctomycetota bacterium]